MSESDVHMAVTAFMRIETGDATLTALWSSISELEVGAAAECARHKMATSSATSTGTDSSSLLQHGDWTCIAQSE